MNTRTLLLFAAVVALGACGKPAGKAAAPETTAQELLFARVSGELPVEDPLAPAWDAAREVVVPLLVQDVAEPRLTAAGAETVSVRGLHDGARAAILLSWEDASGDGLKDVDFSTDACAIQLPASGEGAPLPDAMMGETGKAVVISLWRWGWQRRVDGEAYGVEALYPNAAIDHYPPEGAKDPEVREKLEKAYNPPHAAGNAIAAPVMTSAVEDLRAEGFGTLAHLPEQRSSGRGVHRDGRWHVVIVRPLSAPGAAAPLRPGVMTSMAFAVWDGGKNHAGARKMRSIWVPVVFAEDAP